MKTDYPRKKKSRIEFLYDDEDGIMILDKNVVDSYKLNKEDMKRLLVVINNFKAERLLTFEG